MPGLLIRQEFDDVNELKNERNFLLGKVTTSVDNMHRLTQACETCLNYLTDYFKLGWIVHERTTNTMTASTLPL